MKGTLPEGRAAHAAKTSESQLLAETASSRPERAPAATPERIAPRAPHPAAVIRALAPTVAEWMPTEASSPSSHEHKPEGSRFVRPDPPVSAVVERGVDESLAAVGLKPGDVVDRTYRIERTLGVGGMGVVALAHDERLDRRVAIKLIKPELFAFPEMRTFFDNEARAMARVSHPNVVHVYAFGEHGTVPYFVMEYVEGRTVEHWLRSRPAGSPPDLDEAVRILDQACLGVEAIHESHTVHRDIKPSNLLLEDNGRVRVGDLGVARILESVESANVVVGSALYMAPEAALAEEDGSDLAARRDIYALGCLAYELFTGRPPFLGATDMNVLSQHVLQDPAPPSTYRPDLPPGYDEILLRALAKDPHRRYTSVGAFRRALLAEHSGTREPERILIADDDPDWRTIIGDSLRTRFPHAQIDQVGDGMEALAAFESQPYSVVLIDLEMPEIDGAKLTLLLRSLDASQRTPIIVLTAAGGPREWQRLSAIGADAFLVKPVNADDVELLIRRTLRSRHSGPTSQGEIPTSIPPPKSTPPRSTPPKSGG
ncbi:MAG: serine/threonine protein kinase [Labilithrix sp.]|nr:serine/threonine protein kinase [Labilithrix sp.]